jgi:hypothetical protein
MSLRKKFQIVVDDAKIAAGVAAGHPGDVIEPVWFLSDIYNGPFVYERTLEQFSQPQLLVRAMLLYLSEVNNGGHKQFFFNSSGIVWRDARDCFETIGVPRGAHILSIAADRMGGDPSLERDERQEQLAAHNPDFKDLDEALYALNKRTNLNHELMLYISGRPADFYFSGTIEKIVLPGMADK